MLFSGFCRQHDIENALNTFTAAASCKFLIFTKSITYRGQAHNLFFITVF